MAMLGVTLVSSMVGFICGVNFLFCIILNLHVWFSRLVEHLVSLVKVCELCSMESFLCSHLFSSNNTYRFNNTNHIVVYLKIIQIHFYCMYNVKAVHIPQEMLLCCVFCHYRKVMHCMTWKCASLVSG